MKKICLLILITGCFALLTSAQSQNQDSPYLKPDQIDMAIQQLAKAHPDQTALHLIGKSWSGLPVYVLEVGNETRQKERNHPAVFVAANFEGSNPLANSGALWLIRDLLKKPDQFAGLTWYILPSGNPEALLSYFNSPLVQNERNLRPWNDDMDDQTDEDPAEDLNGDGYITQMRVKVPDGTMVPDSADARIMKRADLSKGQRGIYKLYTEGIDNDRDGQYNEDGIGGTNNGISFPHLFQYHHASSGEWPGQEAEVFGVLKFFTDHPEIALVMYYGQSNYCLQPPQSGRKGEANLSSLKIPRRFAAMLNADPEKTYSMSEVKEMVQAIVPPGTVVDDSMIASMMDLGQVVNPLAKDLKIYTDLSKDYKAWLKKNGGEQKRLDPEDAKDGSFELWVYYHQGLPVFSQDFWGIPVLEKAEKDTAAQKKPTAPAAPPGRGAKKPDREKEFLTYNDSLLKGAGFIDWKPFVHPELGEVEIGGVLPYADVLPAPDSISNLLEKQIPWIYELAGKIPKLDIEADKVTPLGGDLYRVEVWIRNNGAFHFPLEMGSRNGTPPPAVVLIEGKKLEIMEGLARTPIKGIDAGAMKKLSWLIRIPDDGNLTIRVRPVNAYGSLKMIQTGGSKS